jgi:hypothetical protein
LICSEKKEEQNTINDTEPGGAGSVGCARRSEDTGRGRIRTSVHRAILAQMFFLARCYVFDFMALKHGVSGSLVLGPQMALDLVPGALIRWT